MQYDPRGRWTGRILALISLAAVSTLAAAQPLPAATVQKIESTIRGLPKVQAAVVVADTATGDVLVDVNGRLPLKPASVQKLLTTSAFIDRFGREFVFRTYLYYADGDLWVIGGGDPSLGDERLAKRDNMPRDHMFDQWAGVLKQRGITQVGRILLDDTIFDDQVRHPDWPDDQADRWYQAPVAGLNLNNNCLDVGVKISGQTVALTLQPAMPAGWIDGRLGLGKRHQPVLRRSLDRDVFEVRGTVTRSGDLDSAAVRRPTAFFGHALKEALQRRGVAVAGSVASGAATNELISAAQFIAVHETPLVDVLWRCNTFSQNMFAECLFKALPAYTPGGQRSGVQGSWPAAEQALLQSMAKLGVDMRDATVRDGSGLSAGNRATAAELVRLLTVMRQHPSGPLFVESLARPAEDGSMKNRYRDPAIIGRVQAKTGTLRDVAALAGYATRNDGRVVAFAILLNGAVDVKPINTVLKTLITDDVAPAKR